MRPRTLSWFFALLTIFSVVLSACGGGGSGSSAIVAPSANPTATPAPVTSESQQVAVSTTGSQTASFAVTGYSSVATLPSGNVATTLSSTFSTTQPGNTPVIQSVTRRPQNIGASPIGALAFLCIAPAATVTLTAFPAFTLTLPSSINGAYAYVAFYNPANSGVGWTTIEGPASGSGATLAFAASAPGPTLQGGQTYCFLFFTLASALPTPTPTPTATPSPTASPTVASAFTCPSDDTSANAVARSAAVMGSDAVRRASGLGMQLPAESTATGLLAVTYSTSTASGTRASALATAEQSAGGTMVRQYTFARTGKVVHVLAVPAAQMSTIAARLRAQSGVESVAPTGLRRYATAVTTPYFPDDPYFNGFTSQQNTNAGNPAATTFQVGPYDESEFVPGQWDMHAIKLEDALAYSQTGNGSSVTVNSGALGSSSVKIAIIDTGEDPNHPELASKIAYQKCYITSEDGTTQSSSNFETDPLGHGTDVSGIAAADTNNDFGFAGTGGNVVIYAYRVFPTPDDNCANDGSDDPQCGGDDVDIISSINDAIAQHVNVISMSLGGAVCSSPGQDSDPLEGQAVAEAIANNIVVVAASGNSGASGIASPGCDTGVIAVGATSISDGTPNGSNNNSGTALAPAEYVTHYTQYGSPNTIRSATSWGIVAPGGDPTSDFDNDALHWIENIWTTTPYQSSSFDASFTGECTDDYPNGTGTTSPVDCRTLIAGTSMATPHVAGAAALILSATGGLSSPYQSSAKMKTLLCTFADDLPGSTSTQGCGRLNVYTAMAHALGDPSPPTSVP